MTIVSFLKNKNILIFKMSIFRTTNMFHMIYLLESIWVESTFHVTLIRFGWLFTQLLKLSWRGLWKFTLAVTWELHWCKPGLLQCPAYLTNSGNPRYPGVSLRVVIWVLFTEKDVDFLIVRVILPLHPWRRDERGLCERRTCLPNWFNVYSTGWCQQTVCDEKGWPAKAKQKVITLRRGVDRTKWVDGWTGSGQTALIQIKWYWTGASFSFILADFPCLFWCVVISQY